MIQRLWPFDQAHFNKFLKQLLLNLVVVVVWDKVDRWLPMYLHSSQISTMKFLLVKQAEELHSPLREVMSLHSLEDEDCALNWHLIVHYYKQEKSLASSMMVFNQKKIS